MENLNLINLWKNHQNICYIKVQLIVAFFFLFFFCGVKLHYLAFWDQNYYYEELFLFKFLKKIKLVSSTLQTVLVKLFYSPMCFI